MKQFLKNLFNKRFWFIFKPFNGLIVYNPIFCLEIGILKSWNRAVTQEKISFGLILYPKQFTEGDSLNYLFYIEYIFWELFDFQEYWKKREIF